MNRKFNIKVELPIGSIILWGSNTIPDGWLLCNFAAISRTTYAKLFALWGTTFGAGDGTTTFNVAGITGYFPIGADGTTPLGSRYLSSLNHNHLLSGNTGIGYGSIHDAGHNHIYSGYAYISSGNAIPNGSSFGNSASYSGTTSTGYASLTDSGHTHSYGSLAVSTMDIAPARAGFNFIVKFK